MNQLTHLGQLAELGGRFVQVDGLSPIHCTLWSIKTCHFYFLKSFVKHWPISIIFGTRN